MSMSAEDIALVENAVQGALGQLEKKAPKEYAKMKADSRKMKAVTESARAAATEHIKLSKEFAGQPEDIAERLAKHLPENRIQMIREGLDFPTFRMDITKKSDGKHWVEITREGKLLEPGAVVLAESLDIDWSKAIQYASILVEAVMLVLSTVGISLSPSEQAIDSTIDETVKVIQSSSVLQTALNNFVTAWNSAAESAYQKAKALFYLISDSYSAGILWTIIAGVCTNMEWYDWLETAAKVTAMIIVALATDGVALIAKIALTVLSAVDFARKIANLNQLETIKGIMWKSIDSVDVRSENVWIEMASKMASNTETDSDCKSTEAFRNSEETIPDDIENSIGLYMTVIEQLKLQEYYPKKLTREKALVVSENIIFSNDLKDAGKIPWFILQNLIMCNYEGRCFEVNKNLSFSGMEFSSLLQGPSDGTSSGDDTKQVSPADALVALFMCCDDFLRQLLVEKLSMCQLAIPLLLPFDTVPHTNEMLLWAMSTLRKKWKTRSGSSSERSMAMHPLPIVSSLRLGRPQLSKSKILNCVINDQKHDIFFHSGCKGGTLERKISNGLLEIAWYLPTGKHQDIFPDALTFMNLRGNASHLKRKTAFISEISLATIAFTSSDKFKKEDTVLLESLYKQNGHLILVVDGPPGKCLKESIQSLEQRCCKTKEKHLRLIDSSNQNELQISGEIRRSIIYIYEGNGRTLVPDKSIEKCADVARKMSFHVDENTPDCLQLKENVNMISKYLKPLGKEKLLPLQGVAIEIGEKMKEQFRLKLKGNMQTEEYAVKVQLDITTLRKEQRNLSLEDSDIFKLFKISYAYPVLKRKYFCSYVKVITDMCSIDTLQPIRQEYISKWNDLCEALQENKNRKTPQLESRKTELDNLESKLSNLSLGLEHFNREIGQMYEMALHLKLLDDSTHQFPVVAAEMLLDGYPLELMDGDASHVPLMWIEAVLMSLKKIIGDKRMFVLSVLGVQSSGKSTMLNAMFGLQFAVSAGRCTKGVFAQLIPVDTALQEATKCNYILVVDTEGLRAPELASIEHSNRDNELATFVIGLGDATIINIMGENATEMQDTLQIAVHAFMKMEKVNIKPSCIFVHQNVTDVEASDRNTTQKRKIKDMLDEITQSAAKEENCIEKYQTFSDVIQFQENKHIMYVSSLWQGDPPMAPPNPGYSQCILQVKLQIIEFMRNCRAKTVDDFKSRLSDLWKAILCENFVFSFKNTIEIQAFNALETEYVKHSRTLRRNAMTYSETLRMECNRLVAKDIEKVGKSILEKEIAKLDEDVKNFHKSMDKYFSREKNACQWKGRTEVKANELCEDIRKEINDEFGSIRKKIIGRAEIDTSMKRYEKDILQKAKSLADEFRHKKISELELKSKFDEEWEKWISDIAPPSAYIDIESSIERIFRTSFYSRDQEEVTRMFLTRSVHSGVFVREDDLDFGSWISRGMKLISGRSVSKSTCLDKAKSITTCLRSSESIKISNYMREGRNYSDHLGSNLIDSLVKQLSEARIDGGIVFNAKGKVRVPMCILWSLLSSLKDLQTKYRKENDLRSYMEAQKERLWQMFRDECTMVEISVKTASMVSRELESAIRSYLPSQCKQGVIDHLRTSNSVPAFANKMSFHAWMLIGIAEENEFTSYRKYLPNPFHCMSTYIGKYIETCLKETTKEGNPILQDIYCQKLDDMFVKIERAISVTCKHYKSKCKISIWWPKLLENIGNDLDVRELGFFNEDGDFDVHDLKEKLLSELKDSKDKITKSFRALDVLPLILEPCRQFFEKDLLGCPELCVFCKAPCDLQAGDVYDDHRTDYHRPQGVSGYRWADTQKLCVEMCTTSVLSKSEMFSNEATKQKYHHYQDYQSVNQYYKAWKIQPIAGESQLYWKWFMATYNDELAQYYCAVKADIPSEWNKISWKVAKQDMMKTYNL